MSNYPEIRFKGFTDAWEQRELGKNARVIAGGTPRTSKKEYWYPKEIPWMSSGEINKRILFETDNKISQEGFNNSSARWIKKNSVLVALAGQGKTRGMVAINKIDLCTNQSIAAIMLNENLFYHFVYQNLLSRYEELRLISSGDGTRGGLNKKIISEIVIVSPSYNEQKVIGKFFESIDETITLHQRKLEKIKETKQAFLQTMFPESNKPFPTIRFKGFYDIWKQYELNKFIARVQGNDGRMNLPTLTISASNGWMDQKQRFSENIAGKEQKNYTLLKKGELSYNHGNSKLAKYGVVFELNTFEEALVPKVYHSFRTNHLSEPKFIQYFFENKRVDRELSKLISSGARMDGLLNITYNDFSKIKVIFPILKEQKNIAKIFEQLDNTIILYQKELKLLNKTKQAFLQKLFPN